MTKKTSVKRRKFLILFNFGILKQKNNMKKIVLLALVSFMTTCLWAAEPISKTLHKAIAGPKAVSSRVTRNNKPKSLRSGPITTVPLGKAGNVLSVLDANCHQIDVDSALNTVIFIHRSDTVFGTSYNVAQYRYDISTNGGTSWNVNIGPLNPIADNITINGRYPEAVLRPDTSYPNNPDSAWIVYNGSWHNGGTTDRWQGQFYGVGRLDGDKSTFTQHDEIVNGANVEISTSMIESAPGNYWNLNLNYTALSTALDTIRGIIIEHGLWNDSAGEVIWTYTNVNINSDIIQGGSVVVNNLSSPMIAFDPTGQYGWIVMEGDMTADSNFTTRPIYMQSSNYGNTWSAPQSLNLDNLPGMFTTPTIANLNTLGKTLIEDIQVAVDSSGNPHIAAVVGLGDTTSNTYGFYPNITKILYDLYYNPTVSGCSWQANYMASVNGYSSYYTSDNTGDANRVQISRSKDGTKIFLFWADSDSTVVAGLQSATNTTNTNPSPNLFGIGIDMTSRLITDAVDFTAGNALFGGTITTPSIAAGSLGGALFPVVSPNALDLGGGTYNIPVVLTDPDYLDPTISTKLSTNPASFYYAQNVNFSSSQYVNKFDNAPPTLTLYGPDTVWVLLGSQYNPDSVSAFDCVYGVIHPQYSSSVPTSANRVTDSIGIYQSTWTATNGAGNTASVSQVVIVAAPPIARIWYTPIAGEYKFDFRDSTLNYDTARVWTWGDGTNPATVTTYTKTYLTPGTKMVTLTAYNRFGSSADTVYVDVHLAGINDVEISNKISIYPNPSNGLVNISMTSDMTGGATIYVYSMIGEQVGQPTAIKPGMTSSSLDLTGFDVGVYTVKIQTPSGTAIKEISLTK
jgi:hypothetical protein